MEIDYASSPGAEICPDCGCSPEPEEYDMYVDSALRAGFIASAPLGIGPRRSSAARAAVRLARLRSVLPTQGPWLRVAGMPTGADPPPGAGGSRRRTPPG